MDRSSCCGDSAPIALIKALFLLEVREPWTMLCETVRLFSMSEVTLLAGKEEARTTVGSSKLELTELLPMLECKTSALCI